MVMVTSPLHGLCPHKPRRVGRGDKHVLHNRRNRGCGGGCGKVPLCGYVPHAFLVIPHREKIVTR